MSVGDWIELAGVVAAIFGAAWRASHQLGKLVANTKATNERLGELKKEFTDELKHLRTHFADELKQVHDRISEHDRRNQQTVTALWQAIKGRNYD